MEDSNVVAERKGLFHKRAKADSQSAETVKTEKAAKPAKTPRSAKQKKKRKRILIILIVVAAVVLFIVALSLIGQAQMQQMMKTVAFADTMTLSYGDIENSISATGTVESNDSHVVYSTQSYQVKSVAVEVGDVVQEGDLLCELDAEALEDQIKKAEITAGITAESAAQQVKSAKDNYNATKDTIEEGTNSALISAESAVETAHINWQNAQRTYQNYYSTMSGNNANLISADTAVASAKTALDNATPAYNTAKAALNDAKAALAAYTPPAVTQADVDAAAAALNDAQTALNTAKTVYEAAKQDYINNPGDAAKQAAYETTEQALTLAQADYDAKEAAYKTAVAVFGGGKGMDYAELARKKDAAQAAYDTAYAAYSSAATAHSNAIRQRDAAYQTSSNTLIDYAQAVETARINYENAVASYNATIATLESQLQTGKNTVKTAEISAKNDATVFELANLQESLEKTRIKAPAAGTVTAVYASVGQSGSGVLFVVEDTKELIVETTVKEYDIGTVAVGMPVTIKSDATGDEVYEGVIKSIAPTSVKTAQGTTNTTGDVLFKTVVTVTSQNTPLRIGMNVRLHYIVERQEHVLSVPYDALYTNAAGEDCVMLLQDLGTGKYMVTECPVTLGTETDLDVAVSGVPEGSLIITDASTYETLLNTEVTLAESSLLAATAAAGLAGFTIG